MQRDAVERAVLDIVVGVLAARHVERDDAAADRTGHLVVVDCQVERRRACGGEGLRRPFRQTGVNDSRFGRARFGFRHPHVPATQAS